MVMTPQEITDYKRKWKQIGAYTVKVHSDLHIEHKNWCRRNASRHQWSMDMFTAPYENTFYFEFDAHAVAFAYAFKLNVIK
jgi:hypothetical protein